MTSELKPLDPRNLCSYQDRDQFEAFMLSGSSVVEQVQTAVDGMTKEYSGWLGIVASGAEDGKERLSSGFTREDIIKLAGFSVWKYLVDEEEQGGTDELNKMEQ